MSVPLETVVQVLDKVAAGHYELCDKATPRMQLELINEGGEIAFTPLSHDYESIHNVFIAIKNTNGRVDFNAADAKSSSWGLGKWVLVAGATYWYRNELQILARGIMAGANLAIKQWEDNNALEAAKQSSREFYMNHKTKWESRSTQTSTASQNNGESMLGRVSEAHVASAVASSSTIPGAYNKPFWHPLSTKSTILGPKYFAFNRTTPNSAQDERVGSLPGALTFTTNRPNADSFIDGPSTSSTHADKGKAPQHTNTTYFSAFDSVSESDDEAEYDASENGTSSVCEECYQGGSGTVWCSECTGRCGGQGTGPPLCD